MSAGLLLGLERPAAAKFGFLLAIPAVVASGVFQLEGIISGEEGGDEPFGYVALATVIAFAVGYAAIAWFLRYLAHLLSAAVRDLPSGARESRSDTGRCGAIS